MENIVNRLWQGLKKGIACSVFAGAMCIGCGDEELEDGPLISNIAAPDYYEGSSQIGATVTASAGRIVSLVEFSYRPNGSSSSYTTEQLNGTTFFTRTIDFPSDEFEYVFTAEDNLGYTSTATGVMRKWADEVTGDTVIQPILAGYKQLGYITDYDVNAALDVSGNLIACDFWVLFNHPSYGPTYAVGWHQGQQDGQHTAEKAICDLNDVSWSQINSCVADEIPAKLDEIRQAHWDYEN
jgi:hypothetical protein